MPTAIYLKPNANTPPEIMAVMANSILIASQSNYVYDNKDGTITKINLCRATTAAIKALQNKQPIQGLPYINKYYGLCAEDTRDKCPTGFIQCDAFQMPKYQAIVPNSEISILRNEIKETFKKELYRAAERRLGQSNVKDENIKRIDYVNAGIATSGKPVVVSAGFTDCFLLISEVLRSDPMRRDDWTIDTGNDENWVQDNNGSLIFVDFCGSALGC